MKQTETEFKTSYFPELAETARRAFYWTSFVPERRGEQTRQEHGEQLDTDINELTKAGIEESVINEYKNRFVSLFTRWLHARSNCASTMITGGSNFNVERNRKRMRSEENHYTIFQEWRTKAKKAIIRKAQPAKTFSSELDRYRAELASMQRNHELMKRANKLIKKAKQDGKDISADLMTMLNIDKFNAEWAMKWGFGLQNNNANMKRVEDMIKTLESKEKMLSENPVTKYSFDGGEFVINYEVDRIQVYFSTRPSRDELQEWKNKGLNSFNWSPSVSAWQRKITPNALRQVKQMFTNISKISA